MSDFGDKSGVSSAKGYDYQKLIAAYYLIVKEAREIEYEADGEDVTIINEDSNRDSIEYIQVKCISTGSFTLSTFRKDVFPQFWDAYSKANRDKAIYCTFITNVAWDLKLKRLVKGCSRMRESGFTLENFEKYVKIADREYNSLKGDKNSEQFRRFLWGLKMIPTFPPDHVKEKILSYMLSCRISSPHSKLALVINHISTIGQGRITRRQIEDIAGNLTPIKEASDRPKYSDDQVNTMLSSLESSKSKYGADGEIPDAEDIYRDMTAPIEKASKLLTCQLEESSYSDSSTINIDIQEALEIIESDTKKAGTEAQTIASLTKELWIHKKGYVKRISSMQKTAQDFGIKL